jgi:hypothetical protein
MAALLTAAPARAAESAAARDAIPPVTHTTHCGAGIDAISYTPAPGFDPLTATDAELEANGLPPRPTDSASLALWRGTVKKGPGHSACPTPGPDHDAGGTGTPSTVHGPAVVSPASVGKWHSSNWSGYVANGHTYTYAKGEWKIGDANGPATDKSYYSSSWVGVGSGDSKTHALVQAGTDSNEANDFSSFHLWWEVYPQKSSQTITSTAHYGDTVYVSISFTKGHAKMYLRDFDDSDGGTYTYNSSTITPDGTAEWITERPEESGYYPYLADSKTTFTDAYAKYGSTEKKLGSLPRDEVEMWNCQGHTKEELDYPGAVSSSGTSFTTHWKHYGSRVKSSDCYPY